MTRGTAPVMWLCSLRKKSYWLKGRRHRLSITIGFLWDGERERKESESEQKPMIDLTTLDR